jgi:hypothetical protein
MCALTPQISNGSFEGHGIAGSYFENLQNEQNEQSYLTSSPYCGSALLGCKMLQTLAKFAILSAQNESYYDRYYIENLNLAPLYTYSSIK